MRHAGKGLLSLALMDARNHTLRWMTALEQVLADPRLPVPLQAEINPPLWTFGQIGWFQEHWISRNVQRHRGDRADPTSPRLASIEPMADAWFDSSLVPHDARWLLSLPDPQATRQYLFDTLETTLELLEYAGETDDALYFFRLALFHEDAQSEVFAVLTQTLGLDSGMPPQPATAAAREPLLFPATSWRMGVEPGGFAFDDERAAHLQALPEFEIDAQAVTWAQYCEFVEDGGYDEARWWGREGWAWVQGEGRRGPRHVDQMRQGVLLQRFGRLTRAPLGQAAMHVNWHEADAWCRWAGRRLPSEVEWEHAVHAGASRGLRWGQVWEWTASSYRPYPDFRPGPVRRLPESAWGAHKVLRGASFATRDRLRHARLRNPQPPHRDDLFTGFRSCAV